MANQSDKDEKQAERDLRKQEQDEKQGAIADDKNARKQEQSEKRA